MTASDPRTGKPAIVGIEALTPAPGSRLTPHVNGQPKPTRTWKIAAIVPCFNRRADLELLLQDVARQDLRGVELWLTIVDNASTEPLSTIRVPQGLTVEFVRLEKNTGGSGGFNAGMSHVLSGAGLSGERGPADFLWWLDSDARVSRRCLIEMVKVLARSPKLGGVGSAMGDLATGHTWEVGGNIVPRNGKVWPAAGGDLDRRFLVKAQYLAACSALIRREAVEKTGLFPDNFIYYDDVEWCIQMTARTGMQVRGIPRSRAYHPPGNRRYVTWARYYIARNCFAHIDVLKMGGWIRFRRAILEVPRAVGQAVMGLPELAELHLRGLRDALTLNFPKLEPRELVSNLGFQPFPKLRELIEAERNQYAAGGTPGTLWVHPMLKSRIAGFSAFRRELKALQYPWPAERRIWRWRGQEGHLRSDMVAAFWRLLTGPTADVAVVPTGWPTNWFRGRTLIQVTTEGLLVRRINRWQAARQGLSVLWRGLALAVKIGRRKPYVSPLPPAPAFRPQRTVKPAAERSPAPVG